MYVRSLTWRDASDCSVTTVLSSADLALGPADVAEGSCPVERPRQSIAEGCSQRRSHCRLTIGAFTLQKNRVKVAPIAYFFSRTLCVPCFRPKGAVQDFVGSGVIGH